jgi:putative two-component system response regulator
MTEKQSLSDSPQSPSLLVVEDDQELLNALQESLESAGYTVKTATDGKSALGMLQNSPPDLILSDTSLPIMDGLQLLKAVRDEKRWGNIPFILLGVDHSDNNSMRSEIQGLDGYIKKPVAIQELLATIQTELQTRASDLKPPEEKSVKEKILVVEDDYAMQTAFQDILEAAGYSVRTAADGAEALEVYKDMEPALILSDISMPIMDGIELFKSVRRLPGGITIPFIFLTAYGTREDILTGMSLGADAYITKPITSQELLSAVEARLKRSDELLVAQLKIAYKSSLVALANAIEARDEYTHQHVMRTNAYAQSIASELGWDKTQREVLEFGAILHDIGKLGVPVNILRKKEALTPEEWDQMRRHPIDGAHMIEDIDYLAAATPIILYHHECWDGTGYPEGLENVNIPRGARLLAVVDTFEAMTTDRPYRGAIPPDIAYEEILSRSGHQFDPEMVQAFSRCWEKGDIHEILEGRLISS